MYGITVAAELAGMSVQALRLYERKGLVEPARTGGGTRRYSDTDIARLRRISVLITDGINLTGIARVLGLEADNDGLRTRNADLKTSNAALGPATPNSKQTTPLCARHAHANASDNPPGSSGVPTSWTGSPREPQSGQESRPAKVTSANRQATRPEPVG